jgi:hypothetical protein
MAETKRKKLYLLVACTTFVMGLAVASVWYLPRHIWWTVTLDGAGGTRVGAGRRGDAYSFTSWKSCKGTIVDETTIHYPTAEDARADFADELKGDGTIIGNDGGTIVRVFGDAHTKSGAAEVITLKDTEIHYVKSVSLRHVEDFEESWIKLW